MRVTTDEATTVVVVLDGRGYELPACFNRPPAVTLAACENVAKRFPRANDNPGGVLGRSLDSRLAPV